MEFITMVIDDDPVFLMLIKRTMQLGKFHQNPISFETGPEALLYLKDNYKSTENYVLFLDINMPEMDGWEFLGELQKFTSSENMKVFIITSSIDRRDQLKAENYPYIIQFLTKPVFLDRLESVKDIVLSSFDIDRKTTK